MAKLSAIIDLHSAFNNKYGIGNNLTHYLAQPKILQTTFDFEAALRALTERQHPDDLELMKMAPQDVAIFKKRASLLATNNDAYLIAMQRDPTVEQLEKFSFMMPCWSTLFPIKHYLMHHVEKAKVYRGFLPYGSEVVKYVNNLAERRLAGSHSYVPTSPSYADHVHLQQLTNTMSDFTGTCTIELNNMMYLDGKELN